MNIFGAAINLRESIKEAAGYNSGLFHFYSHFVKIGKDREKGLFDFQGKLAMKYKKI